MDTLSGRPFYFKKLVFERDGERVTGFRLSGSRVHNLWFERLE